MSNESAQVDQRRANLAAIEALGFPAYPHRFDATHTVAELVHAHGGADAATLEAERVDTTAAGRILSIRSFGKAAFLVLSDGRARLQVYVRQDALSEREYAAGQAARLRRHRRCLRTSLPHQDQRALDLGLVVDVPGQVLSAVAGEVAWPAGRRDALPAALSRPGRQPRCAPRVRAAQPHRVGHPRCPDEPRLPRSRDADDAADCRRRAGAAVRDASQRARHEALSAHRAGALPEAPGRRRHRAGLRDQPQLPQRRHLDPAQPRVHDAGVLLGLRRLPDA